MSYKCYTHNLNFEYKINHYLCKKGCYIPIINNIPRFIELSNYADSFGFQWNKFRKTQLDSYTKTDITLKRLLRILNGSFSFITNKIVLEAGCGAGRFTEIILQYCKELYSVDISNAVEANYLNFNSFSNYNILQADINCLPFKKNYFDCVLCIGVIQHTLDTFQTLKHLAKHLKKNGLLIFDHYSYDYPVNSSRKFLRKFLLKIPCKFRFSVCFFIFNCFWPLHVVFNKFKTTKIIFKIRGRFLLISPVVDYFDS